MVILTKMNIGVLALQGDFNAHRARLKRFGVRVSFVKKAEELCALDALILPGGESSTLLKLIDDDFQRELISRIQAGLPTLATCAGTILLARAVESPQQESFGLIDITVERNAYGRQIDSFVDKNVQWTRPAKEQVNRPSEQWIAFEGIFIRAPRITHLGEVVKVLATRGEEEPVLVKEKNILAASFHPELSNTTDLIYEMLLDS